MARLHGIDYDRTLSVGIVKVLRLLLSKDEPVLQGKFG